MATTRSVSSGDRLLRSNGRLGWSRQRISGWRRHAGCSGGSWKRAGLSRGLRPRCWSPGSSASNRGPWRRGTLGHGAACAGRILGDVVHELPLVVGLLLFVDLDALLLALGGDSGDAAANRLTCRRCGSRSAGGRRQGAGGGGVAPDAVRILDWIRVRIDRGAPC